MKSKQFSLAALAVVALIAPGCASIVKGSTQSIVLTTSPEPGATCVLSSPAGASQTVTTPSPVTVGHSKHDINVTCNKDGFSEAVAMIPSTFEDWTLGNLLFSPVVGTAIDAATGAMHDYPNDFNVEMTPKATPTPTPTPASGTAPPTS